MKINMLLPGKVSGCDTTFVIDIFLCFKRLSI